jgi:hypothetical protein
MFVGSILCWLGWCLREICVDTLMFYREFNMGVKIIVPHINSHYEN